MADKELDAWICDKFKIDLMDLSADDLFNIITYFFPSAEFCADDKLIADTGCAYLKFKKDDTKEQAVLISDPTKGKTTQVLYSVVIALAKSVNEGSNEIIFSKFT